MGREKFMSSQQLVNLRIDFAFKQLFGTSGNRRDYETYATVAE